MTRRAGWPARAVAVVAAPAAACSAAWPGHGTAPVVAAAGALLLVASLLLGVRAVGTLGACMVVLAQILAPLQLARAALTAVLLFAALEALEQGDLPGNLWSRTRMWLGAVRLRCWWRWWPGPAPEHCPAGRPPPPLPPLAHWCGPTGRGPRGSRPRPADLTRGDRAVRGLDLAHRWLFTRQQVMEPAWALSVRTAFA
ncbi:hypothetical protein GXW82_33110 [Streptacidiphilus sp. 4-A2]|nr:hypothetical protein [Streptacidiphilus sp. 4-A2]